MATQFLKRLSTGWLPVIPLVAVLLVSLYLMGDATENSARFGRMFSVLLVINALGLAALVVLIGINLHRLIWQYRRGVAGARLTARMVVIFVVLAVAPVLVVYYFSLQFLHRGIDSWFDVRIEQALEDSLELSQLSLDIRMKEVLRQAELMASELREVAQADVALALDELRERNGASELTLLASNGRVLASSNVDTSVLVPSQPGEGVVLQVRQSGSYVGLDPIPNSGLHVRAVVKVTSADSAGEERILQALYTVPKNADTLATNVQDAFSKYKELAFLRKPLKYSFTLTLSLVLLLSLLAAVLAAIFSARRIAAPIRDLAEGTRAVAAGDYAKRVPLTTRDELGFLVQSFNTMTRRIARASADTQRSQQLLEEQNAYLEAVLGHLSSGVITIDEEKRIQRLNSAAQQILGIDALRWIGHTIAEVGEANPDLRPFATVLEEKLEEAGGDWDREVVLSGAGSRKVLTCSGTALPGWESGGGFVVVFDDVTALVQAQRDAAWGEVARRLAHEIKNPLTPIQLSAERMRQKFLARLSGDDARSFDRYTNTIVQQVKSMKEMVNAFSDYARPPRLKLTPVSLNPLIQEVAGLYSSADEKWRIDLDLADSLPLIQADAGRLRQLLHNLIKNAREATVECEAPLIEIGTTVVEVQGSRFVQLRVCDNGPGFPEAIAAQVFEPYVTGKPKGSGLGLAIVKKIVEEHSGMITTETSATGGACLNLQFPVVEGVGAPPEAVRAAPRSERPETANGSPGESARPDKVAER
ncbi:MAG: ATP-binding protein [Gammaproteobacteria bacterium]